MYLLCLSPSLSFFFFFFSSLFFFATDVFTGDYSGVEEGLREGSMCVCGASVCLCLCFTCVRVYMRGEREG